MAALEHPREAMPGMTQLEIEILERAYEGR
jgi:hypothetical protein